MQYIFLIMLLMFMPGDSHAGCPCKKKKKPKPPIEQTYESEYLWGKIPPEDQRHHTFAMALQLMQERGVKTIVETGTARGGTADCVGDGCSTLIWAAWARDHQAALYSVDIDPSGIRAAKRALIAERLSANLITSDSITFLKGFNQSIDFLYLDSYDFDINNPIPSQEHHLREIVAATPWLTPNSIVMIDDCDLPYGGKGKLAIEYLLARGWKILVAGYQVILVQP